MGRYLIVMALLLCSNFTFSQDFSLSGKVKDADSTPLLGATVVVLDAADSTMLAFGVTDDTGKFLVYDVPDGKVILQVSFTGYSDYGKELVLSGDKHKVDVGEIVLKVSSAVLEEVSIKAEHIPMGILGDTINYNAAAFQTRPGASVEDLLKKLPGIEVARDGSIKAQGKDVENVLVDGKEFFSGDATIATKNLEAEAVEKVQVYDKKSEEAEFTGIDDGQEEKTINLKLKEGFKNGGFGKVAVDAGTEDTRQAKLNYNRFSPSVQASIIGNTNNINKEAFSFNEYIDFMGGFQNVMATGGLNGYGVNMGQDGGQNGIIDQKSFGSNLNVDFSKAIKLNANYLFAQSDQTLEESGSTQNFTNNETFTTLDTSNSINNTTNHRINTKLKFNPNPRNAFTLNTRFYALGMNDIRNSFTDFLVNGANQNMTTSNTRNESDSYNINSSLVYKKKYAVKGRNWISSIRFEAMQRDEQADINNVFKNQTVESFLNQYQLFANRRNKLSGDTRFTEPIGKGLYLSVDYAFNNEVQKPQRDYFNRIEEEIVLDENISNIFESEWSYHNAGVSLKRNRKNLNLTTGLTYMIAHLGAFDNNVQLNTQDGFHYVLPSFNAKLKMKGSKSLEIGYSTSVNAPQLSQMVTQVNNLNPNFLILGNPNLTPEYMHTIRFNYSAFDQFNFSSQFANVSLSYSANKIVNSRNYRSDLVSEVLPVNAGNYFSANAYFNHNSPIRKLKIKYKINTSFMYSQYSTFINEVENNVTTTNANLNLGIENRNKDIIDIAGGLRLNLSAFSNEFNSNFATPFLNYSWYVDGFVNFGKGFNLGVSYDYQTYNSAFFQDAQILHLLDASFSKSILADKFTIKLTAHDLLNQNRGIARNGNINSLSDNRFNALGRYVMLGVSYRLGMTKKNGIEFEAH